MQEEHESDEHTPATDTEGRHAALRENQVEQALDAMVEGGRPLLFRTVPELLASGAIAGIEISLGVLAFLTVEQATGSQLLAGIAFASGFVALLLGNSELFTEGFLIPVAVAAAKEAPWYHLPRYWLITLVGNLTGGWVGMWMIMTAFPRLHAVARDTGSTYANSPFDLRTFLLAVLAGSTMTLLTRMRVGTTNDVARVLASIVVAFLVAGLGMFHSVLDSLFLFGGLHAGASYSYLSWIGFFGWAVLGNMVGGIGITTFLRLVRSHERLYEWRRTETPAPHPKPPRSPSRQSW